MCHAKFIFKSKRSTQVRMLMRCSVSSQTIALWVSASSQNRFHSIWAFHTKKPFALCSWNAFSLSHVCAHLAHICVSVNCSLMSGCRRTISVIGVWKTRCCFKKNEKELLFYLFVVWVNGIVEFMCVCMSTQGVLRAMRWFTKEENREE